MASIKIHLKLLLGENGTPLLKLINITDKVQNFLTDVGKDLNLKFDPSKWVAKKFQSSDLNFDIEYPEVVAEDEKNNFNKLMKNILGYYPIKSMNPDMIGKNSIKSFFAIREVLDFKEQIEMQLYDDGIEEEQNKFLIDNEELQANFLEYETAKYNITGLPRFTKYYGSIRGTIVTVYLQKSSHDDKPNIRVMDLATDRQVKCFYNDTHYEKIYELIKSKNNAVIVEGLISLNPDKGFIECIEINKIEKIPEFQEGDWEKFFGKLPNLTDSLSIQKYIDYIRGAND